jgi:MoxR-like ATPase
MPSDITGHAMYIIESKQFQIRRGPAFTNLFLADEINRAPAKTQAALLEVMQERQITIEGKSYPTGEPFMVLATQNPIEQEGTYPLPEAELDRFLMKIYIDYPSEEDEKILVRKNTEKTTSESFQLDSISSLIKSTTIIDLQRISGNITVDEQVMDYAVHIVRATRDWSGIAKGASPRGSLALVRTAKAHALLAGNNYVTPDDIKKIVLPVLRHRLILSADMEIEGIHVDRILNDILEQIPAPRL